MKKTLCLLLPVVMVVFTVAGCKSQPNSGTSTGTPSTGGSSSTSPSTSSTSGDSTAPKVIRYANGAAPPTFNPIESTYAKTSIFVYNTFCGLYRYSKDGVAEPGAAASVDISEDALTYTFHLRKNINWSDVSDLTAPAV